MTDTDTDGGGRPLHSCPTGHHDGWPSRNCYEKHGCRCAGCHREKLAANRKSYQDSRTRVVLNVDHRTWTSLERGLKKRGLTVEQFMRQAAERFTA